MYHSPTIGRDYPLEWDNDQLLHLRHLKAEINQGAAEEMQDMYPEGYLFMTALYGLAWAEFAENIPNHHHELFLEAYKEVEWATKATRSRMAQGFFPRDQRIEYGAYYSGWSNYMLGKKINLNPNSLENDIQAFQNKCNEIASVITSGDSPYVESYYNQVWPADITVAVACLALHDRIFPDRYQDDIQIWLDRVRENLDEQGMIPHVSYEHGHARSRGSSMSLMLCFLPEIDANFSKELFSKYKEYFLTYRFGLPGIREYQKGINEGSDVDSGPVILSVGGSASIVGQRAFTLHQEKDIALGIKNSIEGFGIGWSNGKKKQYLFGQLPIADAFIAWVNGQNPEFIPKKEKQWRWKFHLLSLLINSILVGSIYWIWKPKRN